MVDIMMMSIIFIDLVFSVQFGSFIDPFIILPAIPLCIVVGLLLSLKLIRGT